MPLKHFVYIIQENITFDHYFGTFPGVNGIPKGAKFAYQPGQAATVAPFHLHQTSIPHDLNHSWQAAHVAADGGKMDGFLWAEWPQALAYYWKGTLPTLDPEDIMPVSGALQQAGGNRRRSGASAARGARALIAQFDADGDGKLDASELARAIAGAPPLLKAAGAASGGRQAAAWLHEYDRNSDGQIGPRRAGRPAAGRRAPGRRGRGGRGGGGGATADPASRPSRPPGRRRTGCGTRSPYYDWHEIPNYWEYARRYTLCDAFFSSVAGPSEPNHLYTVAARSGGLVNNPPPNLAGQDGVYTFPTMAELLEKSGM